MSAIVTNKFRQSNAKNFYDSFGSESTDKYYLFVGRSEAWSNDNSPPIPNDSIVSETKQHRDMIAAKQISQADVSYVLPRRDWTTNTTYDMYHHNVSATSPSTSGATNLWDSNFYVINSAYEVYICISNNNGGVSTSAPLGIQPTTNDGYIWKYLYTLSTINVQNHLSLDFMPVFDDLGVAASATPGSIEFIKLIDGGSGYVDTVTTANPTGIVNIDIQGDGTSGTVDVVISNGSVTSVVINGQGTGYTFASIDLTAYEDPAVLTSNANLDPIISPFNGHGINNNTVLGGFYVMVNTTLSGAEGSGDFIVNNDFRQVGLIKNPKTGVGTAAVVVTTPTISCLKSLVVTSFGTTHFIVDEKITGATGAGATGEGYVVDFNAGTGLLKYIQQSETGYGLEDDGNIVAISGTITGGTSGASGPVSSGTVLDPAISGDIIYVENRMPIPRATDQQENIKLIVEF